MKNEKDRYKMKYSAHVYDDPWEPYESFGTTGQFAKIGDKTYLRHCGPTAVTNLIVTLLRMEKAESNRRRNRNPKQNLLQEEAADCDKRTPDAMNEIFQDVARTGQHMLIYYNTDLLHHFGGTSDYLVRPYLMRCIQKYGLHARVGRRFFLTEENVRKAVQRGSLLYVVLRHHPTYKNHHIICYSAQELLLQKDKRQVGFYLKCADGWSSQPAYLSVEQMKFGSGFYEILPTKQA